MANGGGGSYGTYRSGASADLVLSDTVKIRGGFSAWGTSGFRQIAPQYGPIYRPTEFDAQNGYLGIYLDPDETLSADFQVSAFNNEQRLITALRLSNQETYNLVGNLTKRFGWGDFTAKAFHQQSRITDNNTATPSGVASGFGEYISGVKSTPACLRHLCRDPTRTATLPRHSRHPLDNLSTHHSPRAAKALKDRGCWFLFLPPYSPDLNPIEMAFAKPLDQRQEPIGSTVAGEALDLREIQGQIMRENPVPGLMPNDAILYDARTNTVALPMTSKKRGGRKLVIAPSDALLGCGHASRPATRWCKRLLARIAGRVCWTPTAMRPPKTRPGSRRSTYPNRPYPKPDSTRSNIVGEILDDRQPVGLQK